MTACDVLSPSVSGNLMPAPSLELCIEVEPEEAEVLVDTAPVADGACTYVYTEEVQITATAEGYEDYMETVPVPEDMTHTITMTPLEVPGDDSE